MGALHARRLAAQLLSGPPAADPVAVCERLLAVQGQDQRGARLAIRARTSSQTGADVDRALNEGALLITWLNRGTLHLVRSEDYPWLHALTTPPLRVNNVRRLRQEGVSEQAAAKGTGVIERALAREGPLTRGQLREHLDRAGVPTAGQALAHLLGATTLSGATVRGPMAAGEHAYVLTRDWLPKPPKVDRDTARAELARRYLAGHGPAGDRDLARWAGLPLRDARAGLAAIAGETVAFDDGLMDLAGRPAGHGEHLPPPLLLGAFDPVLLGWNDRSPIVGEHAGIVTDNGLFRPFALVEGRAVATWSLPRGKVELAPFGRLPAATSRALAAEAADVERFLAEA